MEEHHISYMSLMIVVAIAGIGMGTLFSTPSATTNFITPHPSDAHTMLIVALLLFIAFLLWGREVD